MNRLLHVMTLFLVMLLAWPCSALAEDTGDNLLWNGGFEYLDEDGLPEGWYTDAYVRQEGFTLYTTDEDARTGAHAAVVNNIGMNDARFAQSVSVKPESLYRLSGWIRADGILDSGKGANLSIEGVYVFSESVYQTEGEWQYVELYGETGENQYEVTVFARVGGYSGESQGRAAFDDLSLVEVNAVPGDAAASLWFKAETPQIITAVETEAEADPFWPWLLVLSLLYAVMTAFMVWPLQQDERELTEKKGLPVFFVVGLMAAAAVRIICTVVEGYQVDVNCFLAWGSIMASEGPLTFYQPGRFCDYTPAYLYVLGLNGLVSQLFSQRWAQVLVYKTVPMLCDLAAAVLTYSFARERKLSRNQAGMLGMLVAFNPAIIINSAAWGQMDSVLALGLMLVAWLAIRRKWDVALPVYVLCALIKPQALMLGFLGLAAIIMAWVRHREERRSILMGVVWSVLTAAVIVIPFSIHQESATWLIDLYANTLASYPYATVNTANLYYWMGANWTPIANACGPMAPAFFAAVCGIWCGVLFWRQKGKKLFWLEPAMMAVFALTFAVMAFLNVSWTVVGTAAMALAFAVVLPMFIRSGRMDTLPLCGGVLFILLYVLGIKMHERYLFPALLLLGMACAIHRDRRVLFLLMVMSCTMFINEGIVLDNSVRLGSAMGHLNSDTRWLNMLLSSLNVLCVPLAIWACYRICVEDSQPQLGTSAVPKGLPRYAQPPCTPLNFKPDVSLRWCRRDTVLVLAVTLLYSVVALWNLGSMKAPQKPWKSTASNEAVILDLGKHYDDVSMLYYCEVVYSDFSIATSDDRQVWSGEYWAEMNQGQCYRWKYLMPCYEAANGTRSFSSASTTEQVQHFSGRYVRITAQQIGLILNEVIFRDAAGNRIDAVVVDRLNANEESPLLSDPKHLLDEQDTIEGVPGLYGGAEVKDEPSWYNSTYFDEIYHARTAMEHLRGTAPYETSHPPLGKLLMSVGILLFGMTPFGWRIAGAVAGILMLPAMYVLGKQLTKRTDMAFAAMTMMALDCMHLTQTRIATIDSFPVLFIILSYLFMLRFMQRDMMLTPVKKLLPDLALSGLFMGCGIASKWIGVYAGAGLAVLYFWTCARHVHLSIQSTALLAERDDLTGEQTAMLRKREQAVWKRILTLCLWCVLFFVAIPVVIYLLSYIPYFAYAHKDGLLDFIRLVWNAQEGMFNYHATPGLGMDHPFHSPWYEWPLIKRPMYYAMAQFLPEGISMSIFCFGNPAVWLTGLVGIAATLAVWLRRHCYSLYDAGSLWHAAADHWSVAPSFVLIGLLAQFLPWVLVPRGTYIYHYFASIPFLILGTMLLLHWLSERFPQIGRGVLTLYLLACLSMFVAYYPYASGMPVSDGWLDFMSRFLRVYHS
ncbi:MAG: phospholipid carrier-dependent glycosyltransferase [Aristaeellaceae bacterium]